MSRPDDENPRSIKFHMKRFLLAHSEELQGRRVLDIPAGKGVTSALLAEIGADPIPCDLFPEEFDVPQLKCRKADLADPLPLGDASVDWIICQEGIEHIADQFTLLKEFNRILKPGGTLLLSTPNYSNLRSRLSYLTSESERFRSMLPPNEVDSIWGISPDHKRVYFGHIFLIGIQKLRLLAALNGFQINRLIKTRYKSGSIILFVFLYPWIYLFSLLVYRRSLRKAQKRPVNQAETKETYREIFHLNTSPQVLLDAYLFVQFTKKKEISEALERLSARGGGR